MKKILVIVLTICILASTFCITAFATDPVVIRVCGMKADGITLILPETYTTFEAGWNRAAKLAQDHDWMDENGIVRIVVDLYADWKANDSGKFGSGTGFENSTIRVPGGTRMMINMNGHTIDRGKTSYEYDGEVIFMGKKSDLIINGGQNRDIIVKAGEDPGTTKMGTITGGYSCNGAGGIHMDGNGKLTLNNVYLVGNKVEDDDGAAIAAYNNSTVIMNGGSITNSAMHLSHSYYATIPYGTVYLSDSQGTFTDVEFSYNIATGTSFYADGLAIYLDNSTAIVEDCLIKNNAYCVTGRNDVEAPSSIFYVSDSSSSLEVIKCRFENNGDENEDLTGTIGRHYDIFNVDGGNLKVTDSYFENNKVNQIVGAYKGVFEFTNCKFINNRARLFYNEAGEGSNFTNCIFSLNNVRGKNGLYIFCYNRSEDIEFIDCEFIDNPIIEEKAEKAVLIYSNVPDVAASIFGEGSLNMIVSLAAFVMAGAALGVALKSNKKKALADAEDEE